MAGISKLPPIIGLLGVGALGAAALLSASRPKSRSEWRAQFTSWAGPASDAQDEKAARTERMVRQALESSPHLALLNVRVFAHGSGANNTNTKLSSDIDLVVMNEDEWCLPAPGQAFPPTFLRNNRDFNQVYQDFKRRVSQAVADAFRGERVEIGKKCVKLAGNEGTRIECDLLPCFRLGQFLWSSDMRDPGVIFVTEGRQVASYPEQHLANGRAKNVATGYRFKQIVRILKKIRRDFEERQTVLSAAAPLPSSFEIECAVYNVPNALLTGGDLYDGVVAAVQWLAATLLSAAGANTLLMVNGRLALFPHWSVSNPLSPHPLEAIPPHEVARLAAFLQRARQAISTQDGWL
jgi:hypothetical protein